MPLALSRHPFYQTDTLDFDLWRSVYKADEQFLMEHLAQFSQRESPKDFKLRRDVTPIPAFARAAIEDIKNAVFQRLADVTRNGGSNFYQRAVRGEESGVDRHGSSMNAFVGQSLISELLVMGQVGIFVDNSPIVELDRGARPYLVPIRREDILNWRMTPAGQKSEFQSLMFREKIMNYDPQTSLPQNTGERIHLMWIGENGLVNRRIMDSSDVDLVPPQTTDLRRIPFVVADIGDSLIRTVARHQIALLNLSSSDVWYALKANFPFYTEQRDLRSAGAHLKKAATDGTAQAGDGTHDTNITVGTTEGRAYGVGMDRPDFIHPSPEPLKASMELQAKLERDIRRMVNLAVTQLGQQSAESKQMDNTGLEAGLSFIGLVLENAERKIADYWAEYESDSAKIATIKYPDRYSLKTDQDRIEESDKLGKLLYKIPGRTPKQEIAKLIANALLGGKISVEKMQQIEKEIEESDYLTSDPDTIIAASEAGLVGEQTASMALGFPEDEYLIARKDHAERAKRIAEAQSSIKDRMGARGVNDLSANPSREAAAEKKESRSPDMRPDRKRPVRGPGKTQTKKS